MPTRLDNDLAERDYLTRIYREAPVGLCCFDTQLRYLDINEWLAALNGLSVEEHLGRSVNELFPKLAEGIESQLRHVIETGEPILEGLTLVETPAQPGVRRYFQHNYVAVKSDDGTVLGVSCAVVDITERKRAESELQKARDTLEQTVKERTSELESANRLLKETMDDQRRSHEKLNEQEQQLAHVARLNMMGEMVGGIAHEVSQPLYAISNFASACERVLAQSGTDEIEKLISMNRDIAEQAVHAGTILKRLRSFLTKSETVRSVFDIHDVICESSKLSASQALRLDATVRFAFGNNIPNVVGDRVQVQQVVVNLLLNAFEAMVGRPHNQRSVTVCTSRMEDDVEVSIEDSGDGLLPGVADTVFDAFFTTKPEGMGLGLAISRSIIETHGGAIWVTPKSDRGAIFHFKLPSASEN